MSAPGLGFNIEPVLVSAANPIQTLNQGIEFSTGAFSVGRGAQASQSAGGGFNTVALVASAALIAAALYFRRK